MTTNTEIPQIGPYQPQNCLKNWGNTRLYNAVDEQTNSPVWLKLYQTEAGENHLFEQEVTVLTALFGEPGLPQILDHGQETQICYIALSPFEAGIFLDEWLVERKSLPLTEARQVIEGVITHLIALAQPGFIFANLAPANLYMTANGIHLLNFEFAQRPGPITLDRPRDPAYLAPEQINHSTVDTPTDIYGLGLLFYQLLAGKHPYPEVRGQALALQHLTAPIPDITAQVPTCPAEIGSVINRCLAKAPAQRYHSLNAIATDLADEQPSVSTAAKPATTTPATITQPKARPITLPASTPVEILTASPKKKSIGVIVATTVAAVALLFFFFSFGSSDSQAEAHLSNETPIANSQAVALAPTATNTAQPLSTATPSPQAIPTLISVPNTPTTEVVLNTILPSPTPPPTATPTATNTPEPTATPIPDQLIFLQQSAVGPALVRGKSNGQSLQSLHSWAVAPAWSPNGQQVAFVGIGISQLASSNAAYQAGDGVWLTDSQGTQPRQLLPLTHVKNLAWSPDGQKLAIGVEPPHEIPTIRIIDPSTGVELGQLQGKEPAWQNKQRLAVNMACVDNRCGIWSIGYQGQDARQLTSNTDDNHPAISPGGYYLAYTTKANGQDWHIAFTNLNSGQTHMLVKRAGTAAAPVFSRSGQHLYYLSDYGGSWGIRRISLADGTDRLIYDNLTDQMNNWGWYRPAIR